MKIDIPVVGGAYKHKSLPFDAQDTINMYPERGGPQSKSESALLRWPGLSLFATITNGIGAIRLKSMYETSNHRFFLARGNKLLELDAAGAESLRGALNTNSGPVIMVDNGTDMAIADGKNVYRYTLASNTLATVSDVDCPQTTPVVDFVDGYIFGFNPNASGLGTFQHSDLRDLTTWNSLDSYSAEGSPDRLVSLIVNNGDLMVLGSKSYEWFYNTGQLTGTFQRIPGSFKDIGCAATHSVAKMSEAVFWLGASKEGHAIVYMSQGYNAIPISTKPLEHWINSLSSLDDTVGFTLQHNGHYFYILTFQTGNRSYAYDMTTNEWIRLSHKDPTTGERDRHRMIAHAFFNGKNYVGDNTQGLVYELSDTTYADNGNPQLCERFFSYVDSKKARMFWHNIQLDAETGVGLTAGQGSDPIMELRWSDDGGRTYGNSRLIKIGKKGEYDKRLIEWRLGSSFYHGRIFWLRYSDPTPFILQDNAVAEVSYGRN